MIRRYRFRTCGLLAATFYAVLAVGALWAQEDAPRRSALGLQLPAGLDVSVEGTASQLEDGGVLFDGPVTMTWRDSRFQADRLELRDRRNVVAEGNVLIVWGENRIFGSRMTYDLETEQGVIEDAIGNALDEYLFWAKTVEKIGPDRLLLRSATVTTCTQPIPYWSFSVSRATIHIDHYARMRNVRLRAKKAPVIYLPYLVWPVKDGRAAGLLMPEFGTTQARGRVITQELFIPLGRSADLTLLGRYYSDAGLGGGGELRFVPNKQGEGVLRGFFINDDVAGEGRYRADYRQTQQFLNGFRMVADLQFVSDFDYFSDFERDLNEVASPEILARLEFSRNGRWASLNVRELRREQLSSGLVQQTLPEIEWRGRSRRLGKTPVYLSFSSSLASIQQRGTTIDADYLRGDVAPELSLPWSPRPWIDITPRAGYRWTRYTQSQPLVDGTRVVRDDDLTRGLWAYGIDVTGPKLFRIYGRPGESQFKHTLETRVTYGFAEAFDRAEEVLRYDEIDRVSGSDETISYALVQRLFAKRPRSRPADPDGDVVVSADAEPVGSEADEAPAEDAPTEPVEIASLTINQTRSFDRDVSLADLDGDGVREASSRSSPISLSGRYNPRPDLSLNLRSSFDILFNRVRDVSLSGAVRGELASTQFSLVHRNGLGVNSSTLEPLPDNTQVRLTSALRLFRRDKMEIKFDGSYTVDPAEGQSHFPDQRWQFRYSSQCCTFLVERLTYDFTTSESRRELRFRVDLRGVGKVLSQTF